MSDAQTRLDNVRKAIDAILLGGQKVSYEGRDVTHADLDSLQKLEARYEAKVARGDKGIRARGGTPL
jgi:hypothetical protein